mmetsp:Transcript_47685/g.110470  ORF Transcript_47685/g.110470 Transcript_47685/m.110470 type:complete len:203 (+) Transcript_47685:323-931(+)
MAPLCQGRKLHAENDRLASMGRQQERRWHLQPQDSTHCRGPQKLHRCRSLPRSPLHRSQAATPHPRLYQDLPSGCLHHRVHHWRLTPHHNPPRSPRCQVHPVARPQQRPHHSLQCPSTLRPTLDPTAHSLRGFLWRTGRPLPAPRPHPPPPLECFLVIRSRLATKEQDWLPWRWWSNSHYGGTSLPQHQRLRWTAHATRRCL